MHILGLVAENYKRLRVVEINPKGRVVQITGKNGQGKTSVLDAIWAALIGAKALPEKPVRKGAGKACIKLDLGEFVVTRTIAPGGTHTLTVENAKGTKVGRPQELLNDLLGELAFDPLEFAHMKPKEQVDTLRQVAKVDIDAESIDAANKADYEERTLINREVERLRTEASLITVQSELPKEKIDESAILERIKEVDAINKRAREIDDAKMVGMRALDQARDQEKSMASVVQAQEKLVGELEDQLRQAQFILGMNREQYANSQTVAADAQRSFEAMPNGDFADVQTLTVELQQAQLTNREIDKRTRKETVQADLRSKSAKADELTRAIDNRNEQKSTAIQNAEMPVPGLSFDENQVTFNGIPMTQLGEAEQIRISTSVAMALNPKLRILRILHGEALDEDSIGVLAEMAEQNDFQVWMARVDSSGKVGIVMEDGMVKSDAD